MSLNFVLLCCELNIKCFFCFFLIFTLFVFAFFLTLLAKIDPCHYFSSPGLSWDAMLKMTGVKLEKISDIDKYLFIEKGLRGGI